MKKALAILMVLATVTGVAFADVADIAVSGNAKVTWGMDLENDNTTGFKNEAEWKISIPLLAKKTFTTKSEGDSYAEINIVDAQYYLEGKHDAGKGFKKDDAFTGGDKKIDKVTAKLVFGNVYISIAGKPGFKSNNAEIWEPLKKDGYFDGKADPYKAGYLTVDSKDPDALITDKGRAVPKEGNALRFEPGFENQGIKIGYKAEKFDIAAKLASKADWTSTVEDDQSKYAFGADLSVNPSDMISFSATANYANWARKNGDDGIISLGAKATVKPIADLSIILAADAGNDYIANTSDDIAGVDTLKNNEDVFAFDARLATTFKTLVEAGVYVASAGTPATGYNDKMEEITDISVYGKIMDGELVENFDAWFTVMAYGLLSDKGDDDQSIAIGTGLNYKYAMDDVKYIKPFFELYGNTNGGAKGDEFALAYNLGADYGLFTNTVITAKFEAGATQDNIGTAPVKTAAADDAGRFTLACKVTY